MKANSHGGRREGAGRPSLGTTRKVSITLPDEVWEEIEKEKGDQTMSAYLRSVILQKL
ncbi:CopG family transcriptional regulator [Bacillus salacetis]|uniref:CopG family transcriptional regulator n=1 Tax=Bacillus salacetis TaxID=2315464 RepID=A0A3A1QLM7_9BACI|nr:CopG family transcriptional regulator [Bacillus salacetis]